MRPSFFLHFQEIRKKWSHWPGGQSTPRRYNYYNLCPCARPSHVGECWPGQEFKFSKTVEVGNLCSDLQLCHTTDFFPRKKIIKSAAIWRARVSVHWRASAQFHTKWQRSGRAFQHSLGMDPKSQKSLRLILTTKPLVHIDCSKKTVYESSYFAAFLRTGL